MTLHVNGQKTQDISLESVGTATYNNIRAFLNAYGSAGLFEGGTITDSGSGQIDIAAAKGIIRTTNSELGELVAFDTAAATDVSLTDNSMNYIYVNYNSGVPVYAVTTNYDSINLHSQVIIGRVYRMGTALFISNVGQDIQDARLRDLYRLQYMRRMERGSGSALSFVTATRQPTITAGVFFSNYDKVETAAFDASGIDRFTTWYRNGSGGWTAVTLQQNVDNLNYDNGSGTLTALNGGDYGVHWVYELVDGTIHIQYGQANYTTLSNARNSTVPAAQPTPVVGLGILIGRLIILKSATTIYEASSAFSTVFTGTATTSHNDLANIQGGTSGEYYHLSSAEQTAVGTIGDKLAKATNVTSIDDTGIADGEIAVFNLTAKSIKTSDKTFETTLTDDDTKVPTSGAVIDGLAAKISKVTNVTAINDTGIADGEIAIFNLSNKDIRTSDKTIVTTLGSDDTSVPTSLAVKNVTDGKLLTTTANTPKRTIILSGAGGYPATTLPDAGYLTVEMASNDVDIRGVKFAHSAAALSYHVWAVPTPLNYNGSTLTAQFFWTTNTAGASGNIRWQIQMLSRADDEALDTAWGTAVGVTDTILAVNDQHISAATAAITPAGTPAGGEMMYFRVARDFGNGDTSTADAILLAVRLAYTTDNYSDE